MSGCHYPIQFKKFVPDNQMLFDTAIRDLSTCETRDDVNFTVAFWKLKLTEHDFIEFKYDYELYLESL